MSEKNTWILTANGHEFDPFNPERCVVDINDIAHSLSMQCRFTGHTSRFYSVAEHSVRVSFQCDEADALWGLLHDASEAYLIDLPRPIKKYSRLGEEYEAIESAVQGRIVRQFGLAPEQPKSVSLADKILLGVEARDLLPPHPAFDKWIALVPDGFPSLAPWMSPTVAKAWFLERFRELHK